MKELFYQKKSEWILSCKNNIYPVQCTPFNYSISTLTYIPINIPSKIPTLYINTGNLFSQNDKPQFYPVWFSGIEPRKWSSFGHMWSSEAKW